MTTTMTTAQYIAAQPETVRALLQKVRETILAAVPEAEETFSYAMPAYKLKGKALVYFAAFKNHIGFYATPQVHGAFAEELSAYKQGKGSVQFPLDKPVPYVLIGEMTKLKAQQIKLLNKK